MSAVKLTNCKKKNKRSKVTSSRLYQTNFKSKRQRIDTKNYTLAKIEITYK